VIGNILVTENWKLKGVNDALLVASEALIYWIDFAIDWCFKKVVFDFDSEILVKGINTDNLPRQYRDFVAEMITGELGFLLYMLLDNIGLPMLKPNMH
jgi:hypothetical protein